MENIKNIVLVNNTTETELFKPSETTPSTFNDFYFPQGKDLNILLEYYNKKKGTNDFMEKIGKLNKKFYNCSENYNKTKKKLEKLNDDLFMNLFKQIDCYVEEIERLNKKIASNNNQELKKTIDNLNKEISDKKEKIRNYELKLKEKTENEEKLMKEIESYKRRIIFYKDKIKIGLLSRTRNTEIKHKNVDSYLNNKQNFQKNNYVFANSDKKIQIVFDKNNISSNNNEELSSKIIQKMNSKDDIIYEKDEQKQIKSQINKYKLRESVYKTEENNNQKKGKILSDLYDMDNDNIEKKEEEYSYNDNMLNLNLDETSPNCSSKCFNKQSSGTVNEKYLDEKNKTFDLNNKGRIVYNNQLKKNSGNLNILDNKTLKNDIKSKILTGQKTEKKNNNTIKIDADMKAKSKPRKADKETTQKTAKKNNYIISKFSEINTPSISNKYVKKYNIDKVRPVSIKSKDNKNTQMNNSRITTHQNQTMNKRPKANEVNSVNISKVSPQIVKGKYINKKEGNNKDLDTILKVVNDDYLNSIEMLKTQEEQIKTMLKLMELNEK